MDKMIEKQTVPPRKKRKSRARERLLETASKLFFERGYSEVGIDEIIRESGTAKATFYRHFKSKEILVEAWLQSIHEDSIARQEQILASSNSIVSKITESFDSLRDSLVSADFRGCPYSNSGAIADSECKSIREQIERHKEAAREFYYRIIRKSVSDRKTAKTLADRLFLLYSGAATEAQNLRKLWPVSVAKETALMLCDQSLRNIRSQDSSHSGISSQPIPLS